METISIYWREILSAIGGAGVLLLVLPWLTKTFVKHLLSRDLETCKRQITTKADSELERLKTALQQQILEHEVRFKAMHERRPTVIAELYAKMVDAVTATEALLALSGSEQEAFRKPLRATALAKNVDFCNCLEKNRIYLDLDTCTLVDDLANSINRPAFYLSACLNLPEDQRAGAADHEDLWLKAWRQVSDKIPKAKQALEHEFRRILGVKG